MKSTVDQIVILQIPEIPLEDRQKLADIIKAHFNYDVIITSKKIESFSVSDAERLISALKSLTIGKGPREPILEL